MSTQFSPKFDCHPTNWHFYHKIWTILCIFWAFQKNRYVRKLRWDMLKTGPKKLWGALEDQIRAGSKNVWVDLGNVLVPPWGHPSKFFIHAQSWLKSAVHFPLNRNFRSPKRPPPHAQEGIFHFQVSLGDVLSTLTKFGPNLTTSISAERIAESWITC